MGAEFEPVAKLDASSGDLPELAPAKTPESHKNPSRRQKAPARSERYAVIAAVSAAIISSFVSAGAAVYVSISQANSNDQQSVTNAVRADREKNYTDFSGSYMKYIEQVGLIRGRLMAHQPVDSVRSQSNDWGQASLEMIRGANLLIMTGSPGMRDVATRILETHTSFWTDHVLPFNVRYLQLPSAASASDSVGWEKDSDALVTAINDFSNKLGSLDGDFLKQGFKDLQ
jgi:hypothetical protein